MVAFEFYFNQVHPLNLLTPANPRLLSEFLHLHIHHQSFLASIIQFVTSPQKFFALIFHLSNFGFPKAKKIFILGKALNLCNLLLFLLKFSQTL